MTAKMNRRDFITLLGGAAFVQCSGWPGSRSAALAREMSRSQTRVASTSSLAVL
jgi:hypothetical protein